jgi:hypothetical protein
MRKPEDKDAREQDIAPIPIAALPFRHCLQTHISQKSRGRTPLCAPGLHERENPNKTGPGRFQPKLRKINRSPLY